MVYDYNTYFLLKENNYVSSNYVYSEPNLPAGYQSVITNNNALTNNKYNLNASKGDIYVKNFINYITTLSNQLIYNIDVTIDELIEITNVKILNVYNNSDGINVDIYISFNMNDKECWGSFLAYNDLSKSKFKCDNIGANMNNIIANIKIVETLRNAIDEFFIPKKGRYKMNNICVGLNIQIKAVTLYSNKQITFLPDDEILVIDNINKEYFVIEYQKELYKIYNSVIFDFYKCFNLLN